ncbi:MAG: Nif3-like dinuclear metal center hexameric protein [Ignavibacteriae bacterium]|nr:Nif3-like dinuclear metal center hexameric protein [Ignavibacteriota bacterium]
MTVREIHQILEHRAPKELCWQGDNVGLQVGSPKQEVKKILLTLDVTEKVIAEAKKKQANLIISHHPLIFTPLTSLTPEHRTSKLVLMLAKADIALISVHTNLDFTSNGVSIALAKRLGLENIRVLVPQNDVLKKITVFVPATHVEPVFRAMSDAGAGAIGNYDSCSFQIQGTGTFRGLDGSKPFIGSTGKTERVEELRVEMVAYSWNVASVIRAMKATHPYEEVAYDVHALENETRYFGTGAIGDVKVPFRLEKFLQHVQKELDVPALRYSGNLQSIIRRVAVCGGSGSQLVSSAIAAGADAYVTADVKYHTFQEAEERIALIDAGHYETEAPILESLAAYLKEKSFTRNEQLPVTISKTNVNPVNYYNS